VSNVILFFQDFLLAFNIKNYGSSDCYIRRNMVYWRLSFTHTIMTSISIRSESVSSKKSPATRKFKNLCILCGTERVIVRTWKEKIGNSVVVNTETACPHPECQRKVDLENRRQREKNNMMKLRSEQRALNRKAENKINRERKLKKS